jgi:hypothetical protein
VFDVKGKKTKVMVLCCTPFHCKRFYHKTVKPMRVSQSPQLVFLSSLCSELWEIRKELYQKVNNNGGLPHLYVDEIDNPKSSEQLNDHLASVAGLVKKISRSDMIIVIAARTHDRKHDHGSLVFDSEVSFWEIELYHAVLLEIPTYLIIEQGLSLSNQKLLSGVLRILPQITSNILEVKRDNIVAAAYEIIMQHASGSRLGVIQFLTAFQSIRSAPLDPRCLTGERLACSLHL